MRLGPYLELRNESQESFAKRASYYVRGGVSQRTVARAAKGAGIHASTAYGIILASVDEPAPDGGTVTLRDLVLESLLEEPRPAA